MKTGHSLILASASPRRAQLLREAGVKFRAAPARICEHGRAHLPHATPRTLALRNAERKAEAVAPKFPGRWVLGADTLVALGGAVFGKPRTWAEAERMLGRLAGRTHRVVTAVCLRRWPDRKIRFSVTSRVTFHALTRPQIRAYLRRIGPMDKAGAYAVQEDRGEGIRRIAGSRSNVMGLPMERFLKEWK